MATAGQRRTRSERVAALGMPPGQWERAWTSLRRRDVLARIAVALAASIVLCVIIRGWEPPFSLRSGYVPSRDLVARVDFSQSDPLATAAARQQARRRAPWVFRHDPHPLKQVETSLSDLLRRLRAAESAEQARQQWREAIGPAAGAESPAVENSGSAEEAASGESPSPRLPPAARAAEQTPPLSKVSFQQFFEALAASEPAKLEQAVHGALEPFEQRGLLREVPPKAVSLLPEDTAGEDAGRVLEHPVVIRGVDASATERSAVVGELVLDQEAVEQLHERLMQSLGEPALVGPLTDYLRLHLPATLQFDEAATRRRMEQAAAQVPPVVRRYLAGQILAPAGEPLDEERLRLLRAEHLAALAARPIAQAVWRAVAVTGIVFALMLLCGIYMRYRQRGPLASLRRLTVILLLGIVVVWAACQGYRDAWRAELAPLLLFGMTMTIVHRRELALLLSGVAAFLVVMAVGGGVRELILLAGVTTVVALNLGTIRSRAKLVYVGMFAGLVAMLLDVALGLLEEQPLGLPLLVGALYQGFWALAAGVVMTGALPFVEKLFGVLTDLSLLELGDVAHPLLQQLIRTAPSTYNHSITVGAIAEAAADSIGARGLLVRVGAYFHDIGKMLNPNYYVENQGTRESRHESLVPAMSTLVIISHIKDGADLARKHRLPEPIIDLIRQHHGTTLVEFFYDRAHQQKQADPDSGDVDESTFRYPGPRPQTKEAAVLMLADAVESASRTLIDPTPARIENMVRDIAERRLHDGQFDESGLTLRELRTIEKSLVKSLTSIYHGRIKYPESKTA